MENLHTTINIQKCTRTSNMLLCLLNLALGHFHAYPKYQFLWAYTSHNIWWLVISKFPCTVFKISDLALIPDTDHEPIHTWCRWKLNVCTWISSCGIFFHVIVRVGSDTDEKRGSGFLAWFVSQIFLLLFCLISPRTFYYWQYLSQAGCGPVWCEAAPEEKVIKAKLLLNQENSDNCSGAGEKGGFAKRPLISHKMMAKYFSEKIWCINILFRGVNWATTMEQRRRRNIEAWRASQCQIIIFLSNTELDEKQVFDNNRSVLPPPSPITPLLVKWQFLLSCGWKNDNFSSCGWAALFQNDDKEDGGETMTMG